MQRGDAAFTGSVPDLYDAHLGPLLFEPYAADVAKRVRAQPARRILETAAGTGRVTRALAHFLSGRPDLARNIPLGRLGQPHEVAQAVLMVLGNDYMTGQTVLLNGGMAFI